MKKAEDTYIDLGSPERNLWAQVIREANHCVHKPKLPKPTTTDAMYRAHEAKLERLAAVRFFNNSSTSYFGLACEILDRDWKKEGELAMSQYFGGVTYSP